MGKNRLIGIVVLEGADGTGKTTLANKLVELYDGHYMHLTYRWPEKMFNYQLAALHRAVKISQHKLVVIDRHWVSENVYADIFRNGTKWPELGRLFDRILKRFGAVYIVCVRDSLTYKDAFHKLKSERVEMYDDNEKMEKINKKYIDFFFGGVSVEVKDYTSLVSSLGGFTLHPNTLSYDIEVEGTRLNEFCQYVSDRITEARRNIPFFAFNPTFYNFLGDASSAEFVFIGDQMIKQSRQVNYPWTAHTGSSLFFAKCLTELRLDERHFCYVNRFDKYGENVISNLKANYNLQPIYLGAKAYDSTWHGNVLYPPSYSMSNSLKEEFKRQISRSFGD